MKSNIKVAIIGAGLAGSEAALVLARAGISVDLYEMRPAQMTPAHTTDKPAELVCSNSFKSTELPTAHGLLKHELALLNSPLLSLAKETSVPAGSALAVNREEFSDAIKKAMDETGKINYIVGEVTEPPTDVDYSLIATGPLTSDGLATWLQNRFSLESFNFYDAIAPIVDLDSINTDIAFYAARWGKGTADYLNCPLNKEEYDVFYKALIEADQVKRHEFEDADYFEGCLPIEVMAGRGYDALRYGMMKPIGLDDPRTGRFPFAVCQLRKENRYGTSFNLVGFQTRMTFSEQKKVFQLIPGLENAEFLKYGTIHRNSYLDSPKLLNRDLSFKEEPTLFLAGQLTGNEGYTESICTGHLSALSILAKIEGNTVTFPNDETACGALVEHITTPPVAGKFTPTNANFGIIAPPPAGKRLKKKDKKEFYCNRALDRMKEWVSEYSSLIHQ